VERLAELRGRSDPRAAVVLLTGTLGRPPSDHTGRALLALAGRARGVLADPDLADRLLEGAAAMLTEPLEAHQARVELHRDTGRTSSMIDALRGVAERSAALGDSAGAAEALTALERVASSADRSEDALAALAQLRSTLEAAGRLAEAGAAERRRADLLLSARNDVHGAVAALGRAFGSLRTARRRAGWPSWPSSRETSGAGPGGWCAARRCRPLPKAWRTRWFRPPSCRPVRWPTMARPRRFSVMRWPRSRAIPPPSPSWSSSSSAPDAVPTSPRTTWMPRRATTRWRSFSAGRRCTRARSRQQTLDALAAAHGYAPADASVTTELVDLLVAENREADAAPYRALLLRDDPFHATYGRHAAWLESAGDVVALARLEAARAERQVGPEAARSWLRAAAAFRVGGREDDARAPRTGHSAGRPSWTRPSPRAGPGWRRIRVPWRSSSPSGPGRSPPGPRRCWPSGRSC
jgi:hypothetical protein